MYQQRGRLSERDHKEIYDYFYDIGRRNLKHFEEYWGDIADFSPSQGFRLSKILYFVAKDLPDHHTGSKNQRKIGKYIKENFGVWEDKALMAIRNFDGKALSNAIWSIAIFGVNPSQKFMDTWHGQAKKYIQNKNTDYAFNVQDFANSLWALAVIQSQNPDLNLKPIYENIRHSLDETNLILPANIKQIYSADLYFTGTSSVANPDRRETTSNDEKRLSDIFRNAGYKVYKSDECPIQGLNLAIDFTVEDAVGNKVHIEYDGPTHFHNPEARDLRNLKYDLQTRFRSALMARLAPEAIIQRIDFQTLDLLMTKNAKVQTAFARAVFSKAIIQGAGCYHAKLGENEIVLADMVPKRDDGTLPNLWTTLAQAADHLADGDDNAALPVPHGRPNLQLIETPHSPRPTSQ